MIWVSGESIIYEKALTIILLPSTAQSNGYCSDKLRDHQVGSFDLDDPFYCCHHLKRPSNILHAYESGAEPRAPRGGGGVCVGTDPLLLQNFHRYRQM